jgi:hypothetical protein
MLPHQTENMARDYVARNPFDLAGWQHLLVHAGRNGNPAGSLRLAELAWARFPDQADFRLTLAEARARSGQVEGALVLLRAGLVGKSIRLSAGEAMLLAELELVGNPGFSRDLYAGLLEQLPGDLAARLGLAAANLRVKYRGSTSLVGFLADADWHGLIQSPIAEALAEAGQPYFFTARPWLLALHRPGAVVLSSPSPELIRELRLRLPAVPLINTRHGVSVGGKNYALYAAAACDHVCVSSEAQGRELSERALLGAEQVWLTGYPQMDPLFRRLACREPHQKKRVLLSCTFNPELSAAFQIGGPDPVAALRGSNEHIRVALTLHPNLRVVAPALVSAWKKLAARLPNVEYLDSAKVNLVELLADFDVLVADVTSVGTQFLAVDRPLVRLVDQERVSRSPAYSPDATEWNLGAAAHDVSDPARLVEAVRAALFDVEPESTRLARARKREELFGSLTDGRSGERIAHLLINLLHAGMGDKNCPHASATGISNANA